MEECIEHYSTFPLRLGLTYCKAIFDSYLCWPPTEAGFTAFKNCPKYRLSDNTQLAYRRCDKNGLWQGRRKNEANIVGWTNYTPCFPAEVQDLLEKVYDDESDPQRMFQIAQNTRYMEIVGFSVSVVALLFSIYIFYAFRSLRNIRTKIHRNLFIAMMLQVVIRLALYLDQAFIRESIDRNKNTLKGLDSLPYVCEACYIALEYGISAMFCWMFIEGLYLHSIITANSLQDRITYNQFLMLGWGTPVLITGLWSVATYMHYRLPAVQQCWYGYNFLKEYWICQGPRLAIILINLVFLLNILRVLIGKLNRSEDSEISKAKKAARAALVLLPLLGITNILNMIAAPLEGSVWRFALWSYTTHFLRSFQGFFIAVIYCFCNGEVRKVLTKMYSDWRSIRKDTRHMRKISRNRNRNASPLFRPLQWVQCAFNNQGTAEENAQRVEKAICCMDDIPQVHTFKSFRSGDATNDTDGA